MKSEQNPTACAVAAQNTNRRACTASGRKNSGGPHTPRITSQSCRPRIIQALQPQTHTQPFGNAGKCLSDATVAEIGSPLGCESRDSNANRYQGYDMNSKGTSMNPRRQPTDSEREALAMTPKPTPRERLCRSVLNTDMLVKVACSAVEDAIRRHHASLECAKPASLDGVENLNLALTPASSLCLRTFSSLETDRTQLKSKKGPFLSRWNTKHMSHSGKAPLARAPTALVTDRITTERSKRASALAVKSNCVGGLRSAPPVSVHWRDRLASVIESTRYDHAIGILIFSNAVFLGISVERASNRRSLDESPSSRAIGLSYAIFFFLELILRIAALGPKFFRSQEATWNLFDLAVVSVSTIQTALDLMFQNQGKPFRLIQTLRCFRVLRAARVLRTFRLFRPLRLLITGILGTLSSCFWALLLLLSIIYLFSIAFTDAASQHLYATDDGHNAGEAYFYFGSIFRSGDTLFQAICGGVSWGEPLRVLGMFKGTVEHSMTDQEVVLESKRKEIQYVRNKLHDLFKELDTVEQSEDSPEGMVTLDELEMFLSFDGVPARFSLLGIEPEDAWNLFKLLDQDGGGMISNDEFISGCLRLRGDAKRIDISLLAYDIEAALMRLDVFMEHVVRRLEI